MHRQWAHHKQESGGHLRAPTYKHNANPSCPSPNRRIKATPNMMNSRSFDSPKEILYRSKGSESDALEKLSSFLSTNPNVVREVDGLRQTLLHHAAAGKRSPEFCKLLVQLNPEAVRATDSFGSLPFHLSCSANNVDTAKYLYQLYPESIYIADSTGYYSIHCLCVRSDGDLGLTLFLLKHDRGAVAKPNNSGALPLHMATEAKTLSFVKLFFDAYPEAIYVQCREYTPLQIARLSHFEEAVTFFESQLEFLRQSAEDTTPDDNGQLPIHRGLFDKVLRLGTIKLMVKANPTIINASDNQGCITLHIASKVGQLDIAKYLIETNIDSLEVYDLEGNCALHHACLTGNCDIINCIIEKSNHGASVRNSEGKLPIQMLLHDPDCNRNSLEYVSAIYGLLLAYPNMRDIAV